MTSPSFEIRKAESTDFAEICRLMHELSPDSGTKSDEHHRQLFVAILEHPATSIWVADGGASLRASHVLHVLPNMTRQGAPYALIENVVTSAESRGQGIGRAMMQHACDTARKAGCYKAMLLTGRRRGAAEFYRKVGFTDEDKFGMIAVFSENLPDAP